MNEPVRINQDFDDVSHGLFFSLFLLAFILILAVIALLNSQTELIIFTFIVIFLTIGLRIWGRLSTHGLDVFTEVDKQRVFPEEEVHLQVRIKNNKLLPVHLKIRLMLNKQLAVDQSELSVKKSAGILWYQRLSFHHTLKPMKRGIYKTGLTRLIAADFFGFFPRIKKVNRDAKIIVYPRLVPLRPFSILKKVMFGKPALGSPVTDLVYILGTRDYQSYSPARNIHWKASARHSKLQEKIFEPTEQEKILLILEGDSFYNEKASDAFERSIEALASLAVELDTRNYSLAYLSNCVLEEKGNTYVPFNRSPGKIPALLELLAQTQLKTGLSVIEQLNGIKSLPPGISCICFSYQPALGLQNLYDRKIPTINIVAESGAMADHNGMNNNQLSRIFFLDDICEPV